MSKTMGILRSTIVEILNEIENDGFPPTIKHPIFGVMNISAKFKIKGRTYYTYESKNNVVHADREIANMYNSQN